MIQLSVEELRELLVGERSITSAEQLVGERSITSAEQLGEYSSRSVSIQKSHSFKIGKAYLIRTVTMHYTGRVVEVTDLDVVLEDAAWIADTGRFANALKDGTLNEIEPYPGRVSVCRGAMVDFAEWNHPLPKVQR